MIVGVFTRIRSHAVFANLPRLVVENRGVSVGNLWQPEVQAATKHYQVRLRHYYFFCKLTYRGGPPGGPPAVEATVFPVKHPINMFSPALAAW